DLWQKPLAVEQEKSMAGTSPVGARCGCHNEGSLVACWANRSRSPAFLVRGQSVPARDFSLSGRVNAIFLLVTSIRGGEQLSRDAGDGWVIIEADVARIGLDPPAVNRARWA